MNYIDLTRAKIIHRETIKISGGGEDGIINLGALESILEHIQNDDYPTIEEKLNHLVYAVNKNHCFVDGNKRLSITLGTDLLLVNGYFKIIRKFITEMENISYHLAAGKISKELLQKVIISLLNDIDFSESLKLEILISINNED